MPASYDTFEGALLEAAHRAAERRATTLAAVAGAAGLPAGWAEAVASGERPLLLGDAAALADGLGLPLSELVREAEALL